LSFHCLRQFDDFVETLECGATNLPVQAFDQEGKVLLASGKLLAIDNQIDTIQREQLN